MQEAKETVRSVLAMSNVRYLAVVVVHVLAAGDSLSLRFRKWLGAKMEMETPRQHTLC